jgi:hypothetical protein
MLLEGAVSLSSYACSSRDDRWPCNGFTASTVPATGLRAVGFRSVYSHLVFLLVIPALRSAARQSIGKLYRQPTFDAGSPRSCTPGQLSPVLNLKLFCLRLQAIGALVAIALVHSDNRLASVVSMFLFATGVATAVLLIAAHDRPLIGERSVRPDPLLQAMNRRVEGR